MKKMKPMLIVFVCFWNVSMQGMMRRGLMAARKSAQEHLLQKRLWSDQPVPFMGKKIDIMFKNPIEQAIAGPVGGFTGITVGVVGGYIWGYSVALPICLLVGIKSSSMLEDHPIGKAICTTFGATGLVGGGIAGSYIAGGPIGVTSWGLTAAALGAYGHIQKKEK